MKLSSKPQVVADTRCKLGEGPLWHHQWRELVFVDIVEGTIWAYSPDSGECRSLSRGRVTGGTTIQEDGSLLLFQDGVMSVLNQDGSQKLIADNQCPHNERFNDVSADPEGRVFAGAMGGGGSGRLYRFDVNGRQTQVLDGIGVPNGMGFTNDLKQMYFTDSVARRIYIFDYDRDSGELSNQRTFIEIPEGKGAPDGMTVDREGFVWAAIWEGWRVVRFSPDGELEREIPVPVRRPTSIMFGGDDLGDMYITSAGMRLNGDQEGPGPHCGKLLALRIEGIFGKPELRSRIRT